MAVYAVNPRGGGRQISAVSLKLASLVYLVAPGQPKLHNEALSQAKGLEYLIRRTEISPQRRL